jgi:hypothetical protein
VFAGVRFIAGGGGAVARSGDDIAGRLMVFVVREAMDEALATAARTSSVVMVAA